MNQPKEIKVKGTHNDFTIYNFPMLPGRGTLDPVRVILNDYGPGRGGIILTCFGEAWTYYWGSIGGDQDIAQFFTSSDLEYFVRKLGHNIPDAGSMTAKEARRDYGATDREVEDMLARQDRHKSKMEYLTQVVKAARHAIGMRPPKPSLPEGCPTRMAWGFVEYPDGRHGGKLMRLHDPDTHGEEACARAGCVMLGVHREANP